MVSTEEMTSRWVSALWWVIVAYSSEAVAICLARVSSSARTRSNIKGATSNTANIASRARMPRSFLSLTRLRLKVTPGILPPAS